MGETRSLFYGASRVWPVWGRGVPTRLAAQFSRPLIPAEYYFFVKLGWCGASTNFPVCS